MDVAAGGVLLGQYRVDRVIGRGGFGYVVAATHLDLGERAVKFLRPKIAADPVIAARFLHEAHAAARLKSHHTVRPVDVGTLPGGAPYIVTELLEGEDLESLIRRAGPAQSAAAAALILETCEAIAEAHALGVAHRAPKPAKHVPRTEGRGARGAPLS